MLTKTTDAKLLLMVPFFVATILGLVGCAPAPGSVSRVAEARGYTQAQPPTVAIFVIDEFDDQMGSTRYMTPTAFTDLSEIMSPTEPFSSAAEIITDTLCIADGTGQGKYVGTRTAETQGLAISHGVLVFEQIRSALSEKWGACTVEQLVDGYTSPHEKYVQCVNPDGSEIVLQAVDSENYSVDSVVQGAERLTEYWRNRGVRDFVLNMSFVLAPCNPDELLALPDSREAMDEYMSGFVAVLEKNPNAAPIVQRLQALQSDITLLDADLSDLSVQNSIIQNKLQQQEVLDILGAIQLSIANDVNLQAEFDKFNAELLPDLKWESPGQVPVGQDAVIVPNAVPSGIPSVDYGANPDFPTAIDFVNGGMPVPDWMDSAPYSAQFVALSGEAAATGFVYRPNSLSVILAGLDPVRDTVFVVSVDNELAPVGFANINFQPANPNSALTLCPEIDRTILDSISTLAFAKREYDVGGSIALPQDPAKVYGSDWGAVSNYIGLANALANSCATISQSVASAREQALEVQPVLDLALGMLYAPLPSTIPEDSAPKWLSDYPSLFALSPHPCTWAQLAQNPPTIACNPLSLWLSETITVSTDVTQTVIAIGASGNFTGYDFPLAPALYPFALSVSGMQHPDMHGFNPGLVRLDAKYPVEVLSNLDIVGDTFIYGTSFAAPRLAVLMAMYLIESRVAKTPTCAFPPLYHTPRWGAIDDDGINMEIALAANRFCPDFPHADP